jgi:hypothetical protein
MKKHSFLKFTYISVLLLILTGYSNASVKFYQSSKINNNGSISITFTYSAPESEVKSNNSLIGNLPFTADKIKEYFSCPTGEIKKALSYKDQTDPSLMSATVDIIVKDFSKISSAKALNGIKIALGKTDSGMVYSWLVPTSFMQTNSIETYQYLLSSEGDIKSTNGQLVDKVCRYFVFKNKMDPAGAYFVTTYLPGKVETPKNTETNTTGSEKPEGSGKSCGLFGLELPFLLLLGFVHTYKKRNKK